MAVNNDNNKNQKSSNDISEMLRLLRESVENEKKGLGAEATKDDDIAIADEEIKATLERVFEEVSLDTMNDDAEDDILDDDDEDVPSWFELESDDEEEDEVLFEDDGETDEAAEEAEEESEGTENAEPFEDDFDDPAEEDPDSDDPWYDSAPAPMNSEDVIEETEETTVESAEEPEEVEKPEETEGSDETEDEPAEEDPDSDDPWYESAPSLINAEAVDVETEEPFVEADEEPDDGESEKSVEDDSDDPAEEDPDSDDPWYDSAPSTINEDSFEAVAVDEDDGETWYAFDNDASEDDEKVDEAHSGDEFNADGESLWYSSEDETADDDDEEETEAYQDDLSDEYNDAEDSEYVPTFDDFDDTESDDAPENDYGEENVYIYDAELLDKDSLEELVETYEEAIPEDDKDSVDETDVNLLSTLGISEPDSRDASEEDVDEKKDRLNSSYEYEGEEYVLENQRNDIISQCKRQRQTALVKLIISGAISLLLLIYEMLPIFGLRLTGIFDYVEFPVSYIMISLQLLIITALLSAQTLYNGVCDLFVLRSTPASAVSTMLVLNTLYSIVVSIATPDKYLVFNSVAAAAITLLAASEYLSAVSEENIFNVFAAKKKNRYAFVRDMSDAEGVAEGTIALKAVSSDFGKNYFSRIRKAPESYGYISYLVLSAIGASLIVFIVSLILNGSGGDAARNAIITLNASMPISVVATFSYPFYRATVKAIGKRGAMVGHSAADEYDKTRFVTFGEEELFTSLKTTHLDLKPSGDNEISDVLNKTGMLLAEIGGPMKRMVEVMQGDFINADVKITEVFDDGVSAITGGTEMLAGSARFLRRHGVEVNEKIDFKDVDETNEVLYVSIGGKVAARYYLKYKPDPEFIKLVNALGARGISVGVKTVNPGINSEIIARRCPELRYKIYTIKSGGGRSDEMSPGVTDSGIVAADKPKQLIYPLLAAYDLKKYYKIDRIIRIALSAISAGVSGVLAFGVGTENVGPLSVVFCQIICLLPTVLYGLIHFRHRAKRKKIRIIYK